MANKQDLLIVGPFRLAFPAVVKPEVFGDNGTPKYVITMLFPKDGTSLCSAIKTKVDPVMEIRRLLNKTAVAKWGVDKEKWPSNLRNIDMKTYLSEDGRGGWPLRDGDATEWDGFAGHISAKATSLRRPGITNAKCEELCIISQEDVWGGLICLAQIGAYAYDNKSKGISLNLYNLQIVKDDGVSFEGKNNAKDVFTPFATDDDSTTNFDDDEDFV